MQFKTGHRLALNQWNHNSRQIDHGGQIVYRRQIASPKLYRSFSRAHPASRLYRNHFICQCDTRFALLAIIAANFRIAQHIPIGEAPVMPDLHPPAVRGTIIVTDDLDGPNAAARQDSRVRSLGQIPVPSRQLPLERTSLPAIRQAR